MKCYYCEEDAAGILTLESTTGNQLSVPACSRCLNKILNESMDDEDS